MISLKEQIQRRADAYRHRIYLQTQVLEKMKEVKRKKVSEKIQQKEVETIISTYKMIVIELEQEIKKWEDQFR